MRWRIVPVVVIGVLAAFALWHLVPAKPDLPPLVRIPAGPYDYRPAGEFRIGTRSVDAPLRHMRAGADVQIMKFQVSEADYALCSKALACPDLGHAASADFAQTGVSYTDALAYAQWFSARTGEHWRLPTDAEWVRAAGDLAFDDALPAGADDADPSRRWLASYRREVAARGAADPQRHPLGSTTQSRYGLADMASNVWEWTETCLQNASLGPDGQSLVGHTENCGLRAVQGKHRAFVVDFVRDARAGGCGAGVPPDYLGFRLLREDQA